MVAGSVGCTRIFAIPRPLKILYVRFPIVWDGLMGPTSVGAVSTLSIRYSPTPKKQSPQELYSPVPTYSFVGSEGAIANAPTAIVSALSKIGVQVVPPSSDRHTPPCAVPK